MWLDNPYIENSFEFKTSLDYKINTILALDWQTSSASNMYAIDRGAGLDIYETTISTYGTETYINFIINQLNTMRYYRDLQVTISGFADNEKVFGEDISYTGIITADITDVGERIHNSWKGFGLDVTLRAVSPSFSGSAIMPDFANCHVGYYGDTVWTVNNYYTYNNSLYLYDHYSDASTFKAAFNFTNSEVRNIRRWMATNRDTSFILNDISGVLYPFGVEYAYTHTVKLINFKERERFGLNRWICDVELSKVFTEV